MDTIPDVSVAGPRGRYLGLSVGIADACPHNSTLHRLSIAQAKESTCFGSAPERLMS
jgi:hypothetical protein